MELPNVPHQIRDPERNVTYVVMAYRQLSRTEVVQMIRAHQAAQKRKPKKGSHVRIFPTLGAND